jgi:hypothetical protein
MADILSLPRGHRVRTHRQLTERIGQVDVNVNAMPKGVTQW